MLTHHLQLSPKTVSDIVQYLDEHIAPVLGHDVSNYALGRRRSWLQYEAPLSPYRQWRPGLRDQRIWNFLVKTCAKFNFVPDVGLVTREGQIDTHRDARYASPLAVGVNLGPVTFHYGEHALDFKGGEVFTFNSKVPHATSNVSPNRWAFNLWTVSRHEMDRYLRIQEEYPLEA